MLPGSQAAGSKNRKLQIAPTKRVAVGYRLCLPLQTRSFMPLLPRVSTITLMTTMSTSSLDVPGFIATGTPVSTVWTTRPDIRKRHKASACTAMYGFHPRRELDLTPQLLSSCGRRRRRRTRQPPSIPAFFPCTQQIILPPAAPKAAVSWPIADTPGFLLTPSVCDRLKGPHAGRWSMRTDTDSIETALPQPQPGLSSACMAGQTE